MIMDMKKLAVGESDFKKIITENYYYVDKSLFIKEIIDRGDTILLLPRPRRFGKTINISMLKYFYDCCPEDLPRQTGAPSLESKAVTPGNTNQSLFDSLAISKAGPQYLEKMGQHPVIFLTFKNIKESDWETTYRKIKKLIRQEYARHRCLLKSKELIPFEREYFQKIIDLEGEKEDYENSLEYLLIFLNRYYGRRAVILIDEYDAPIHAGFTNNYYDQIIAFMRNFLCAGLKDTGQYLEKSVITGIMRIAMESIYSGLNNPGVYTLLAEEFDDKFGFTEKEVETMLADFNVLHMYEQVQQWYNGYKFGRTIIYNPWSIVNFLAGAAKELKPYWINTSDNKIVETLLSRGGKELKEELELLIRGESIEKTIEENIVMKDIESDEDSLWSFLMMGGYLKQTEKRMDASGSIYYNLSIPNMEVRTIYKRIIQRSHEIKSNRESGYGRYDISIIPHDLSLTGYVIEFKTVDVEDNETVESAVNAALKQIEEKKYETELVERGVKNYKKLAIVFNGKEVTIREG